MSKKVLISTLPSWALRYCRVVGVEGRDSHFLSGPNLKKGQTQSNINHFALHSFPSTIVIEQTNGRRPVAGGNKKPFDNYRLRFLPRSSQHVQKPKRATSGCQHQAFSQQHSHMHWYDNRCSLRKLLEACTTTETQPWRHMCTEIQTQRQRQTGTGTKESSNIHYYKHRKFSLW